MASSSRISISIPQTIIGEDDLQTSSGSSDDDFDVSRDEPTDYGSTTEETKSGSEAVEIKFNWDGNVEWTTPQDSLYEKQKLQVNIEKDRRLKVYIFFLYFSQTKYWITSHLKQILYNNEISHTRGTKPVSHVSREEIKCFLESYFSWELTNSLTEECIGIQ